MVSNTNDATLKAILRYRNHPSVIVIQNKCKDKDSFNFIEVSQQQIEKEILKLDVNKASQSFDIPIKVVKENTDFFSNFLYNSFNNSIKLGNYKPVSILPNYQKYLKKTCLNKCHKFLRIYFRNIIVGFGRISIPRNVF